MDDDVSSIGIGLIQYVNGFIVIFEERILVS